MSTTFWSHCLEALEVFFQCLQETGHFDKDETQEVLQTIQSYGS